MIYMSSFSEVLKQIYNMNSWKIYFIQCIFYYNPTLEYQDIQRPSFSTKLFVFMTHFYIK